MSKKMVNLSIRVLIPTGLRRAIDVYAKKHFPKSSGSGNLSLAIVNLLEKGLERK